MTRQWHGAPPEAERAWHAAVGRLSDGPVAVACPVCARATLRFFYLRHRPPQPRGGHWMWCPACRSFEHSSCIVPGWWIDEPAADPDLLVPQPAWLDERWDELAISRRLRGSADD